MDTTEKDIRNLFANSGELDRDEVAMLLLQLVERIQNLERAPQRKPLTDAMTKQMRESCDSHEMRGAFVDGWLSAEAAHNIKGAA